MTYEEIRKALESFTTDPAASTQLLSVIESFVRSNEHTLIRALVDHMIAQNLRAGSKEPVEYGRVQGLQSLLDFIRFVPDMARQASQPAEPAVDQPFAEPVKHGGYGLT